MMSAFGRRQEGADLRRHRHELAAAPEHAHGGIAQESEAGALDRIGRGVAARKPVLANPQEGEVVARHPVEEGDRLLDLVLRQRRRIEAVVVHDLGHAGAHAGPVVHRQRHVLVDQPHGLHEALAGLRVVDARQVDVDEALALHARARNGPVASPTRRTRAPDRVALDRQDRMRHEKRLVSLVDDLGEGRIEQERHVVVDDLEHRHVAAAALALDLRDR